MEFQKHEDIRIKSEHVPLYKNPIDLTQDNDAIEPEVDRIADSISANIHGALKYTLQPFVTQYNSKCNQYSVISGVLRQLPEFQKLVSENAELKMEINNLKREFQPNDKITLEVHEKPCSDNDRASVGLVNEFYKEIKNLEDDDDTLRYCGRVESNDTLETSEEDGCASDTDEDGSASGSEDEEDEDEDEDEGDDEDEDEVEGDDKDEVEVEDELEVEGDDKVEVDDEVEVEDELEDEDSVSGSEEEEELYIVEMELDGKDIQYYTNDDENGEIYTILEEDEVGPQVGVFKDGDPIFS